MSDQECVEIKYKADLAKIPESPMKYAKLNTEYENAKKSLRKSNNTHGINSEESKRIRHQLIGLEKRMESHAKQEAQ